MEAAQNDEVKTSVLNARIPWWITTGVMIGAVLTAIGAVVSKIAPTVLTNGTPLPQAA
ncbi:MAG: hypothetical protein H0X24_22475 [Ktedonobacterales bacterium]|nr:hypothetical protein [Ktedonobacterales bacterium]